MIESITLCLGCDAVTVETEDKEYYSLHQEDFERIFEEKVPQDIPTVGSCNYCINHWGIDLCGCGSGEKFGECENGFEECKRPAQSIEEHITHCTCSGAWA